MKVFQLQISNALEISVLSEFSVEILHSEKGKPRKMFGPNCADILRSSCLKMVIKRQSRKSRVCS